MEEGKTGETVSKMDLQNESEEFGEDISPGKDGGVQKIIKVQGYGKERPPNGSKVRVFYSGKLLSGEEFDSNIGKKEPFQFEHGKGVVIKGWDLAVSTMTNGEICCVTIKPEYAYGEAGSGTKIPPNATLKFEIHLVDWKGEDVTYDGKVTKIVLKKGTGYDRPNVGATCEAKIVGKYNNQVLEDKELTFIMREGSEQGILPGVEEAISKMCSGEQARVWIHPGKWGFGDDGKPELGVPGDAMLEYTIDLKTFENAKENWELANSEKLEIASKTKEKGTKYFKEGKYRIAVHQYARVVALLDGYFKDEEKELRNPLAMAAHLNLAACHLKLQNSNKCIKECDKALQFDEMNVKALFRRGKARMAINDLEEAQKDFHLVLKVNPKSKEAQQQLQIVKRKIKQHVAKEKKLFANMFERLTHKELEEASKQEPRDVFKEALEEDQKQEVTSSTQSFPSEPTEPDQTQEMTSPGKVNGRTNVKDEGMEEDEVKGVEC